MNRRLQAPVLLVLALTLATLAACNVVGPAALLIEGPPKIDAVYKLDPKRPTVVFVDDRNNVLKRVALRQAIAQAAQQELLDQGTLKQVIDCKAAYQVTARDKSNSVLSIVEVGKAVQAEIVIYVTVDSFGLSPDGSSYAPAASMRVKVLDVTKDDPRLWPKEREGHAFMASYRQMASKMPETLSEVAQAEDLLAKQCGRAIQQLFDSHEARGAASRGR
jgi:hypothetical protein